MLRYAAAVESRSEHPVARAIVAHAREHGGVAVPPAARFASVPGMGAEGDVGGVSGARSATSACFDARGIAVPPDVPAMLRARDEGKLGRVRRGRTATLAGAIALADRPRETAREAIELLREHGIRRVAMLTGDHERTAARVAAELGVDEHHAQLLPEQKHALRPRRCAAGTGRC